MPLEKGATSSTTRLGRAAEAGFLLQTCCPVVTAKGKHCRVLSVWAWDKLSLMWNAAMAFLLSVIVCSAAEPTALAIRQSAERAIELLQESQTSWHTHFACISCHQQMLPALAYRDAREHGIRVDESLARADAVAAYSSLSRLERAVEYNDQIDPIGDAARLIGAEAAGVPPSLSTAVLARTFFANDSPLAIG